MTGALSGRVALIVGGANGIGRASVELFAREGARVVFGDIEVEAGLALAERLTGQERLAVSFLPCDVASVSEVRDFVAAARRHAGIADVALYAAGVIRPVEFLDLTEAAYDEVMAINLRGCVFFFQEVAGALAEAERGGSLVAISSIGGILATDTTHAYGTSKAGLIHLAKSAAVSLARYGIRVNTVGPGGVETRMQARISEGDRLASLSRTPMLRLAEPEEIARVALFLASEASSYITGQTICADGGRLVLHRTVEVPADALGRAKTQP
jgi:NAD(P)-dependent dehydrogenase (short-subunit alcohol dehydrogenase family)